MRREAAISIANGSGINRKMAHKMDGKAVSENSIGDPLHKPAKKRKRTRSVFSGQASSMKYLL